MKTIKASAKKKAHDCFPFITRSGPSDYNCYRDEPSDLNLATELRKETVDHVAVYKLVRVVRVGVEDVPL